MKAPCCFIFEKVVEPKVGVFVSPVATVPQPLPHHCSPFLGPDLLLFDTIHSHCNIIDYVLYAVLYISVTIL